MLQNMYYNEILILVMCHTNTISVSTTNVYYANSSVLMKVDNLVFVPMFTTRKTATRVVGLNTGGVKRLSTCIRTLLFA